MPNYVRKCVLLWLWKDVLHAFAESEVKRETMKEDTRRQRIKIKMIELLKGKRNSPS